MKKEVMRALMQMLIRRLQCSAGILLEVIQLIWMLFTFPVLLKTFTSFCCTVSQLPLRGGANAKTSVESEETKRKQAFQNGCLNGGGAIRLTTEECTKRSREVSLESILAADARVRSDCK